MRLGRGLLGGAVARGPGERGQGRRSGLRGRRKELGYGAAAAWRAWVQGGRYGVAVARRGRSTVARSWRAEEAQEAKRARSRGLGGAG